MKVSVNSEEVHRNLIEVNNKIENALKDMLARFAMHVTEIASRNTTEGSQSSIEYGQSNPSSPEGRYFQLYKNRFSMYGINIQTGFHKQAWEVSKTSTFSFDPTIDPIDYVFESAYSTVKNQINLGESFWIGAKGPAFHMLDDPNSPGNHSGYSLSAQTLDDIVAIYSISSNLKQFFDEAFND